MSDCRIVHGGAPRPGNTKKLHILDMNSGWETPPGYPKGIEQRKSCWGDRQSHRPDQSPLQLALTPDTLPLHRWHVDAAYIESARALRTRPRCSRTIRRFPCEQALCGSPRWVFCDFESRSGQSTTVSQAKADDGVWAELRPFPELWCNIAAQG